MKESDVPQKVMKISQNHKNRHRHNWLIYDSTDHWLEHFKALYKGHLYDLGCGEKPYKEWLLGYVDQYTGVDWGNTHHLLKADIIADLNEPLPIDCDVADTVISLSVMEHLREPSVFLSESYRILKPNGAMILEVPFMWWVHEAPYDYFRYTRYGLQYLFEKAGFVDITIHPQTGFWGMWVLKFNYQSTRLVRGPWIIRAPTQLVLRGVWSINQRAARLFDKYWKAEGETAGYFVVAFKR